jgi:hypothetical protein
MTQEEKQILLRDLCSRLPYGVRYKGDGGWPINPYQHTTSLCTILNSEEPLVYLRPMSSMTEEEWKEYNQVIGKSFSFTDEVDWLNAHHFDYRGLIEKGLALESPEGMYA